METTTTQKPGPLNYTVGPEGGPLEGMELKNGRRETHPTAGDVIRFDRVKHKGKDVSPVFVLKDKPKLREMLERHEKAHAEHAAAEDARLHAAVPGLKELEAARDAAERHQGAFNRMMEDEHNDGARPPTPPTGPGHAELAAKYPRAALYLRARDYAELAANDRKASAGQRAMEMLRDGASEEEAKKVLDNWLPSSAWEN